MGGSSKLQSDHEIKSTVGVLLPTKILVEDLQVFFAEFLFNSHFHLFFVLDLTSSLQVALRVSCQFAFGVSYSHEYLWHIKLRFQSRISAFRVW